MAVAAGVLVVPALKAEPASARPAPRDTVIPSRACAADGPSRSDRAVANTLRPLLNGPRLGRAVAGHHVSCARAIVHAVRDRGLNQRAAVIALTTAIAESSLHNYTRAVDHDSLGLFQQRPSQGWGRPDQLTDPGFAVDAFLNAMIRRYPAGRWMSGDIGRICQAVQRSALPGAYAREVHDAQLLTASLWSGAATATAPETAPAAPSGPYQRSLVSAATALSVAEAPHEMTLADWNGDRRADLVVIRRSGTASGRTEVYILDGASNFQRLLLHTGTVLGPTDDRHAFSLADANGDGKLDLVVVQKSGTASGRTEVRVLDGASFFQRDLLQVATALGPTDDNYAFTAADWNADGRPDLVVVQRAGAASGKVEIRVLDAASNFQGYLTEAVTARKSLDAKHDVTTTDWNGDGLPDLVVVDRSGKPKVQVYDGASDFSKSVLSAGTGRAALDDRYRTFLADWDADGRPDLVILQTTETASGRAEVRVLGGKPR